MAKLDDLSPAHLKWLVKSRSANQAAALRLFELFELHPNKMHRPALSKTAQNLVAACFSLWRAAFLADKTGVRREVFADARAFLGKMLTDNAINYPQDRGAREWTFNYYMNNARDCLLNLTAYKKVVQQAISSRQAGVTGATVHQNRWNRYQSAFEIAINCLEKDLPAMKAKKRRASR